MAMDTEDLNVEATEEKQEKSKVFSVKSVLDGSWLAEKLHRHVGYFVFLMILVIFYIANSYSIEKLHREKNALQTELQELRFESITKSADLMFIRKQSEVIKRVQEEGLKLEESKEPPVKLYRK